MIKIIIGLCLLSIVTLTGIQAQESITDEVNLIFNNYFGNNEPGCIVAIVSNNELIYKNSFGLANLEHNIPINSSTVFELGSVAKQFTGYGMAILIAQNKISMEDDIKKFIPELPDYGVKITIDDFD